METPKQNSKLKAAVGGIMVIGFIWFYFGGGLESAAESKMDEIKNQVAADAEAQYNIAKQSGSAMDAYVQAGIVSAAYLQAKDQANYSKWKAIEKQEAERAGIHMP